MFRSFEQKQVKALTPERRGWGLWFVSVSDVTRLLGINDPDLIDAAVQELVEKRSRDDRW